MSRHRRTHETQQDGQQQHQTLSDEDLENEENEFGPLEEGSPASDPNFLTSTVNMASVTSMPTTMGMHSVMPSMVNPQMISPQFLQQQI